MKSKIFRLLEILFSVHHNNRGTSIIVISYNGIYPPFSATDVFNYHKIESILHLKWDRSLILQGQENSVDKYPPFMDGKVISPTSKIRGRFLKHFVYFFFCLSAILKLRRYFGIIYFMGSEFLPIALFGKIFLNYRIIGDVDTYTIAYNRGEIMSYGAYDFTERLFEPFMASCDIIIVINERDRDILINKGFDVNKMLIMPPSREVPNVDPKRMSEIRKQFFSKLSEEDFQLDEKALIIAFHGSATAQHNKKTIDIIVANVMPKVLERNKRCLFLIIGGGYEFDSALKNEYRKNIYFTGFLSEGEMKDLLSISDLYIAPMTMGAKGGTKTKIIEAAMYGLPIITTPEVGEQYFRNSCPFLISSIENFSKTVIDVTQHKEKLKELGNLTLKYIIENYSSKNYEKFRERIASLLNLEL